MKEILFKDYELDSTKTSVIPNGLSDVVNASAKPEFLKHKWGVKTDEKSFFCRSFG